MGTTTEPTVNGQLAYTLARHVQDVAAEMAKEDFERPKIYAAMDFVLKGAVDLGKLTVTSGLKTYHIDPMSGCPCQDAKFRSRYCKHTVALDMARSVAERMGDDYMAATKNAQDEWEAKVQNGEAVEEQEPEDLFEGAGQPTPVTQDTLSQSDEEPEPPRADTPSGAHRGIVEHSGHQYNDYPSTLCIKRHIGHTELSWTFRGDDDADVWARATGYIRKLDEAAKRAVEASSVPPPPEWGQAEPATAPQQQQAAPGNAPLCPQHQRPMKPSQYGGFYCTSKNPDGSYCKTKG